MCRDEINVVDKVYKWLVESNARKGIEKGHNNNNKNITTNIARFHFFSGVVCSDWTKTASSNWTSYDVCYYCL